MGKHHLAPPDPERMTDLIATPGPTNSPIPIRGNLTKYEQRVRWARIVADFLCETKLGPRGKGRVPR